MIILYYSKVIPYFRGKRCIIKIFIFTLGISLVGFLACNQDNRMGKQTVHKDYYTQAKFVSLFPAREKVEAALISHDFKLVEKEIDTALSIAEITSEQALFLRLQRGVFLDTKMANDDVNNILSEARANMENIGSNAALELQALYNIYQAKNNTGLIQEEIDSLIEVGLEQLEVCYDKKDGRLEPYLSNISKFYIFNKEEFEKAEHLLAKRKSCIPVSDFNLWLDYYYDIGFTLLSKGKMKECMVQLSLGNEIIQEQPDINFNSAVEIHELSALAYANIEDEENMENHFQLAKKLCQSKEIIRETEILFYTNYALRLCYLTAEVGPSIALVDSVLTSCSAHDLADLGFLNRTKGYIYSSMEMDTEAVIVFKKSIKAFNSLEELSSAMKSALVDAQYGLAESYFYLGNIDLASEEIEKAFVQSLDRTLDEVLAIKDPVYLKQEFEILDYLRLYRQTLMKKTMLDAESSSISKINKIFQLEKDIVEVNKQDFISEDLKYILPSYHSFYGDYLNFLSSTPLENSADMIFEALENSRAHIIYAKTRGYKLAEQYNVPDKYITELKSTLSKEEKLYTHLYKKGIEPAESKLVERRIAANDIVKNNLFSNLEKAYPNYFRNFLNPEKFSLKEVQKNMPIDKCFVEYQFNNNALFSFYIDKDTTIFNQRELSDHFSRSLSRFLDLISKKPGDNNNIYEIDTLTDILYEHLIADFSQVILGKKEIIISPDGDLQFLPFDLLKDEKSEQYLIEKIDISYACSVSNYFNSQRKVQSKKIKKVTAFSYSNLETLENNNNDAGFSELPGAYAEVMAIQKIFGKQIASCYLGPNHTAENFREVLSQEGILHLATHAKADTNGNADEFIVFRDIPQKLYLTELIGKDINAHTAVLSACETAKGDAIAGEGVFHIARIFLLAGVRNVVMTQWVVDDVSGKSIIKNLYENLSEGKEFASALSASKRNYLASSKNRHPYYWAGYCLMH